MTSHINRIAAPLWLIALALMVDASARGQPARQPPVRSPSAPQLSSTELLRWKFNVGDVIELQHSMIGTFTAQNGKQHRNKRDYRCLWTITDVAPNGLATVVMKPTRIRMKLEFPPVAFDSDTDDPKLETRNDTEWRQWIYEARSMANAELTFEVDTRGVVRNMWGAVPHVESIPLHLFTTADMPALPSSQVSPGDEWSMDVSISANSFETTGRAAYRLVDKRTVAGRTVCRIEGKANWASVKGPLGSAVLEPTVSIGRFDIGAGRFFDERVTAGAKLTSPSGESCRLRQLMRRRLKSISAPPSESVSSGEYLFAFKDDDVLYLLIAGEKQKTRGRVTVHQILRLVFFHDWEDTNQDGAPDDTELIGINTRFSEREGIKFLVLTSGLHEEDVRADLVDSQGVTFGTVVRILRGPGTLIMRHLKHIEAGVYFLEWYVNDQFLIRVPVQIHSAPVRPLGSSNR